MPPPFGKLHQLQSSRTRAELLIVAPHPDDEVIGPGGRALLEQGAGVAAVIVTDGARGAAGDGDPDLARVRELESLRGLERVGASFAYFLQLSSEAVRREPEAQAAAGIRWALETWHPSTVLTTAPFEHHPTHVATTRATLAAVRSRPGPRVLGYPVWDSIPGSDDVEILDISSVIEDKLDAVRCHETQMVVRPFDEAMRCRHFLDAHLQETTGVAAARFVECTVDLTSLCKPGAPSLEDWMTQRFEKLVTQLLGRETCG